jgi:hypothetical protein
MPQRTLLQRKRADVIQPHALPNHAKRAGQVPRTIRPERHAAQPEHVAQWRFERSKRRRWARKHPRRRQHQAQRFTPARGQQRNSQRARERVELARRPGHECRRATSLGAGLRRPEPALAQRAPQRTIDSQAAARRQPATPKRIKPPDALVQRRVCDRQQLAQPCGVRHAHELFPSKSAPDLQRFEHAPALAARKRTPQQPRAAEARVHRV